MELARHGRRKEGRKQVRRRKGRGAKRGRGKESMMAPKKQEFFFDASSHLYKRVRPSVRPYVHPERLLNFHGKLLLLTWKTIGLPSSPLPLPSPPLLPPPPASPPPLPPLPLLPAPRQPPPLKKVIPQFSASFDIENHQALSLTTTTNATTAATAAATTPPLPLLLVPPQPPLLRKRNSAFDIEYL